MLSRRLLKWLVAVPFTAAALAIMAMNLGTVNDMLPTLGRDNGNVL